VSKQFGCGLVVGKFCPLHIGHELLINRALEQSDEVIIISYTKPEFDCCPPALRDKWIRARFPSANILVIDDILLEKTCVQRRISDVLSVPHNDAPDEEHRQFVAWLCMTILNTSVDVVFTSEEYGNGFADFLTQYFQSNTKYRSRVPHICIDIKRDAVPISGTIIRSNPHEHRQFLSPEIYASFVERICLLGGESTGKTTLAQALAYHLKTNWVPEYGRELWALKNGHLFFDDMLEIGHIQLERESEAIFSANHYLLCDTSPLTTIFYSQEIFGKVDKEMENMISTHKYDYIFLCAPDFDFVQDGTRRDHEFRMRQHTWYLTELNARKLPYSLLEGSLDERINKVLSTLTNNPA